MIGWQVNPPKVNNASKGPSVSSRANLQSLDSAPDAQPVMTRQSVGSQTRKTTGSTEPLAANTEKASDENPKEAIFKIR